ncbi:RNA ligase family protein [Tuwongella immobilis]|uniref:Uncharacterized protein n=1 Tax=Tuwongella immobilis TaxID=692036 RepID=A0A6C2YRF3_9BACT|nr:RNA ligase family protein [Tuwongella immobilis]VIP04238.1 Uncharacterized protein OS=Calothrix sp. PCC 7507 GN=Cal7507_0135 PE=4 SV=1 [Tuwongella immobilis]VTS05840.1 Uncharacterized protein OS=Calothrix sp. PCC 7507 GN=Cal7507_0135 PE=4 SV=1 [Tuwongella immobilis]
MLYYPKIPGSRAAPSGRCVAFEKYDGTNLHWDWDADFGWVSFGTRRDAFDWSDHGIAAFAEAHPDLADATRIFEANWAHSLAATLAGLPAERLGASVRCFTEFFGPSSFAGRHLRHEPKELRLIDVESESAGMWFPDDFLRDFGHLAIARVIASGKLTGQFADEIRRGKFPLAEGVICKGVHRQRQADGRVMESLWMVKIKTDAYQARLRQAFADRWEEFWE